ncbi:MAG: winged helix-turn-helix domain-containing protein [Dermatophilaceae bacterium]
MRTIKAKEPPTAAPRLPARHADLDARIMAVLTSAARPAQVAQLVGISSHLAAVRLKRLADRGLVTRARPPGAPLKGPGSILYGPHPRAKP